MPGRRWSEGLHQAVEAKEGVKVKPENVTHATITLQNYFRKYEKLAGMTGTAVTEAEEFSTIYSLDVLEMPTNLDFEAQKPDSELSTLQARDVEGYTYTYYAETGDPEKKAVFWKRKDYPDVVYRIDEGKLRAIVLEILQLHVSRPTAVGRHDFHRALGATIPTAARRTITTVGDGDPDPRGLFQKEQHQRPGTRASGPGISQPAAAGAFDGRHAQIRGEHRDGFHQSRK